MYKHTYTTFCYIKHVKEPVLKLHDFISTYKVYLKLHQGDERPGSILALAVSKQSSALFCCALDMQIMFLFCLCCPWSFARVACPATFILYVAKKNCFHQQSWISESTMSWPLKNFTQEYDKITTHSTSQMHMYFREGNIKKLQLQHNVVKVSAQCSRMPFEKCAQPLGLSHTPQTGLDLHLLHPCQALAPCLHPFY